MTEVQEATAYYWTALPQALRGVQGDPISGPPSSPQDLRAAIDAEAGAAEQEVTWEDGTEVALFGVIFVEDEGDAEATAASLAMEFGAYSIVEHADSYEVHGQQLGVADEDGRHAFFEWAVDVAYGD